LNRKLTQLLGYLISAALIISLLKKAKTQDFTEIIHSFHTADLIALIIILFVGYGVRTFRWSILLKTVNLKYKFFELYANFLISIGINNLLPLRAGDAYRILGVDGVATKKQLLATLLIEKILDTLSLLVLLLIWGKLTKTMLPSQTIHMPAILITLIATAATASFFFTRNCNTKKIYFKKIKTTISDFFVQLQEFLKPIPLIKAAILSFIGWLPETLIFFIIANHQGLHLSYPTTALSHSVATLSTMIPSSPGFFGTFHYASYTILKLAKVNADQSLVFATLTHFFLWAPSVILSPLLFILKKFGFILKAN